MTPSIFEGVSLDPFVNKFTGSLIGGAVGDALGMAVEGWSAEAIHSRYGVLKDMQDQRFGLGCYTDDTQLTLLVAESLLDRNGFDPNDLAQRFARWPSFARGAGRACTRACGRLAEGISWQGSGVDSAGCGSAMRVAPLGLFFSHQPALLKKAARDSSVITHTDPRAVAGATAVARAVARCVDGKGPLDPIDFLHDIASFVSDISREFADTLRRLLPLKDEPPGVALQEIGTGGFVMETVPAAFYYFIHSPDNLETAMINAVNGGGDTDSIAAILGGIAGAFHGFEAIPDRWVAPLESRERLIRLGKDLANRMSS